MKTICGKFRKTRSIETPPPGVPIASRNETSHMKTNGRKTALRIWETPTAAAEFRVSHDVPQKGEKKKKTPETECGRTAVPNGVDRRLTSSAAQSTTGGPSQSDREACPKVRIPVCRRRQVSELRALAFPGDGHAFP